MRNKMNYPYKFVTKNHMQLGTLTTDVEKERKKTRNPTPSNHVFWCLDCTTGQAVILAPDD